MVEVVAVGAVPVAAAPVNPGERIDAIDILRGIALFGVLAINVVNEFRVSFFEEFLPVPSTTGTLDRAVQTFLTMAVELKAMALFSLLFGIGLAIQFERLAPDPRRGRLLARRLAILLVIGVAHLFLIWNGDILTEYSLAGFIVLPLLWGPRWLLAAGASLFLALYLVMPLLPPVVPWPTTAWIKDHVAEARQVYGTGGAAVASRRAVADDGMDQGSCRRSATGLWHRRISGNPRVPCRRGGIHPSAPCFHCSSHHRAIPVRHVGVAHRRHSSASGPRTSAGRRLDYRHCGRSRADGGQRTARPAGVAVAPANRFFPRSACHASPGDRLCRRHHRFREHPAGNDHAGMGRSARTHGLYELPGAIRHLRLDFLRLWPRPVRPSRRRHRARDRCLRVCRASDDQRAMAALLSVRPDRVAVAQLDVRHGAAFAHPPCHPFRRVRVAD